MIDLATMSTLDKFTILLYAGFSLESRVMIYGMGYDSLVLVMTIVWPESLYQDDLVFCSFARLCAAGC